MFERRATHARTHTEPLSLDPPTSLSHLGISGPFDAHFVANRIERWYLHDAMRVWEHDGPARLNFTGEDLSNAILRMGGSFDLCEFCE